MSTKKSRKGESVRFVAGFRHWRSGEWIEAAKYGHKAFPIRSTKRKPR
jgi:hypothetical protein